MEKKTTRSHFEMIQNFRKPSLFVHVFIALAIALLWILLTPKLDDKPEAFQNTLQTLKLAKQVVEQFKKEYSHVPQNLGDIRTFADYKFGPFHPYDGFASRISYIPINQRYYILKSFGADQTDNHVGGPEDISASHLPTVSEEAPEIKDIKDIKDVGMFPSVTILGAKPNKGLLRARIIINRLTAKRYLLVQNPKQPNFEMVAPMAKVEEFLWLPSGFELVFTVSGDDIYKDGVYLWNLMTNEVQAVAFEGDSNKSPFSSAGDESYWLSLGGASSSLNKIFVFAKKASGNMLNPKHFFHKDFLYEIDINQQPYAKRTMKHVKEAWEWQGAKSLSQNDRIVMPFLGNPAQIRWLNLPLNDTIESTITGWQSLVVHLTESALFPYGLWWLGSLYGEAAQEVAKSSEKDSRSLRAYGVEMAKALSDINYAPRYLQAFATHLHSSLSDEKELPYRITDFRLNK